jgi:hypothetical protein
LLRLFQALDSNALGQYAVRKCVLKRSGVVLDLSAGAANLQGRLHCSTGGPSISPASGACRCDARACLRALLLLLAMQGMAQAAELGRLFLTPADRAAIDAARHGSAEVRAAQAEAMQETPVEERAVTLEPPLEPVTVNGYIARSAGAATVWVNGRDAAPGQAHAAGARCAARESAARACRHTGHAQARPVLRSRFAPRLRCLPATASRAALRPAARRR